MGLLSRNLLVMCLATVPALPAGAADPWSLGGIVPDGVFLYVHTTRNPENEFLEAYWSKVFEAFRKVGLLNEVKDLIASKMPPEQSPDFETKWNRFAELVDQVNWAALFGGEFVYAQTFRLPTPSHLYLFRLDREQADRNAAGLKAILKEIVTLAGESGPLLLTLTETEQFGAKLCTLRLGDEMAITLAQRGAIIAASLETGQIAKQSPGQKGAARQPEDSPFEQALKLLDGDKSVKRLIDRPNYKRAMAALPQPENERFFFDAENLFAGIQQAMSWVENNAIPEAERVDAAPILRAVGKAIDHFKFIDCCASVETTEGYSTHCYSVTMITPGAKDKPLYRAFCGTPPVEHFDKYIPKKATGFTVSSGVDWTVLYEAVIGYIRDELPGGQEILVSWNALQDRMGFHLDRDLLSWMGNEIITVDLPPAIPNPFGGGDWVVLMKVKDQAKAKETIDAGLATLNALIAASQKVPALTTQPAQNPSLEGFLSVTHPMLMMFFRPIYGFADGYMIIGSSESAISRCLKTARGEAPSVRENKRFAKEGLIPRGPVTSISFADKSQMGQQLAQVLGMMGMVGGMLGMAPEDEGAQLMRTIFGMAQKLAPVVAQIDFYTSEASVTTFDGKTYRTEKVTNYKEPPPPKPPAPQKETVAGGTQGQSKP